MFDIYLACLANAALHRRAAILIELSVGLCIAHDFITSEAEARAMLVNVYASAGYNCLAPDGHDYKTINRRVNISFLLFNKIGADAVGAALGNLPGHRRIEAIQAMLAPLALNSMDDVLAYCGRPRANGTPHHHVPVALTRRAADNPETIHVATKHIDVPVPPTATHSEIMELVVKLVAIAQKRNGKRVAAHK